MARTCYFPLVSMERGCVAGCMVFSDSVRHDENCANEVWSIAHQRAEPTIPLTQVEAMLREAVRFGCKVGIYEAQVGPDLSTTQPRIDEWIQNKIKEARAPDKNGSIQETPK